MSHNSPPEAQVIHSFSTTLCVFQWLVLMTHTVQVARPARIIHAHVVKTLNVAGHSFVRMENALRSSVKLFQVDQTPSVQSQIMQQTTNAMLDMLLLLQLKLDVVCRIYRSKRYCIIFRCSRSN